MSKLVTYNVDKMRLQLSVVSNQSLIENYFEVFDALDIFGRYKKPTEFEDTAIKKIAKTFIDEFKHRMHAYERRADKNAIKELAYVMRSALKEGKTKKGRTFTAGGFAERNAVRIYSHCMRIFRRNGIPLAEYKKEFL